MFSAVKTEMKQTAAENGFDQGEETNPFLEQIAEYSFNPPKRGDILSGEVLKIADDTIYLDVGAKRDAIVSHQELSNLDDDFLDGIAVGDEFPVYVTRTPIGDQELFVSLEKGLMVRDWERAEVASDGDDLLELPIVGYNKGGVIVQFGRLRGFVPNSHVPALRHVNHKEERQSRKAKMVDEILPVKVLEVDRQRERLVLSATAAQSEHRRHQLEALEEGQTISGRIVSLVDYGAFVDLGAVHGLLHISKLSWNHVDHPSHELEVGEEIDVLIDKIDVERERVSLNRRDLLPSPWDALAENRDKGDLIEGEVTAVLDFGAFVRLPSGIEGLVHVSEMDKTADSEPQDVLKPGDKTLVRIINIDQDRKRLGLSMRRVSALETVEWMMQRQAEEAGADLPAVEEASTDADAVAA